MSHQLLADPLLSAIVGSSNDAIVARDEEGLITTWNDAAAGLFGYAAEDMLGQPMDALIPPDLLESERTVFDRVLEGKRVRNYVTRRLHRSGRTLEVSLTLSPIRDADDAVVGLAGIEHDVSAHRAIERERVRLIANLKRSNADLEQFAYVASHDLSEPLRAIAGMVDLLARRYENELDETAHDYIRRAVAGTQRMQALITDLLLYSRSGRMEAKLAPVDTAALAQATIELLRPALDDAGAEVELGELPTVVGDKTKLGQVFQNLIANAIKFRGEDAPKVRVSARAIEDGWEFTVADNGIGIEQRHRERIFLIFQRLHGREEYVGTGIGLALCRLMVEAHNGLIWVGDDGPPGTTFHFTVPDLEVSA